MLKVRGLIETFWSRLVDEFERNNNHLILYTVPHFVSMFVKLVFFDWLGY